MLEYDRIDISEELMLIKQVHQKSVIFVAIGILKILVLGMSRISAMVVMIWCKKLWVLIILLLFMLKNVYRINFWYISKDDMINIMKGSNFADKRGVL